MTRGRDKKRTGADLPLFALEITGPFCFTVPLLSVKYFPVLT